MNLNTIQTNTEWGEAAVDVLLTDLSIYVDNGVHPSVEGFKRMAERVRIDLPFLF